MRKETRNVYARLARLLLQAATIGALVVATYVANAGEIKQIIVRKANKHGVDTSLMLAMAQVESNFNPNAIGSLDDIGLFQLRKKYFGEAASLDPRINADAAARYLVWLRNRPACRRYGRYYYVCFNRGPNAPLLTDPSKHEYVVRVEAARRRFDRIGRQLVTTTTENSYNRD